MNYILKKQKGTFYVDYLIKYGKCYVIEEFENRQKTTFICYTIKEKCDDLIEDENTITIII